MSKFVAFAINGSVAQEDTFVIEQHQVRKALVRSCNAEGTSTADLKFYPPSQPRQTTVKTAALAAATSVVLNASATGQINGRTPVAGDTLFIQKDTGHWQMLGVGVVTPGVDQVTLSALVAKDGGVGLESAVAVDNVAYVIPAAEVAVVTIDANAVQLTNPHVGQPGHPLGVSINETGPGTTHRASGVVEFVD
jgi:hypothetical protein